jgi:hypothetical protein
MCCFFFLLSWTNVALYSSSPFDITKFIGDCDIEKFIKSAPPHALLNAYPKSDCGKSMIKVAPNALSSLFAQGATVEILFPPHRGCEELNHFIDGLGKYLSVGVDNVRVLVLSSRGVRFFGLYLGRVRGHSAPLFRQYFEIKRR